MDNRIHQIYQSHRFKKWIDRSPHLYLTDSSLLFLWDPSKPIRTKRANKQENSKSSFTSNEYQEVANSKEEVAKFIAPTILVIVCFFIWGEIVQGSLKESKTDLSSVPELNRA